MFKIKKNINTPEFWDEQFRKEYELFSKDLGGFIRWNPVRFNLISQYVKNNQRILDVSCGLGHQMRYLKARFPLSEVMGLDFSPFAVQIVNQLGGVAFQSDCYSFTDIVKDFDVILATEIIEHVSYPKKMLKEIHAGLKDGGTCIVTTPIKGNQPLEKDHMKEFTITELEDLMSKYFKDVVMIDMNLFQMAIGKK